MTLIYGRSLSPIWSIPLVCVVAAIFWNIHRFYKKEGMPEIQASIEKQFADLVEKTPELMGLHLNQWTRTHTLGSGDDLTGFFEYDARRGDQTIDIIIRWERSASKVRITKIQSVTWSQPPQVLWPVR